MHPSRTVAIALFVCAGSAAPMLAGPVDPPTGAIGPTMKPLDQIEPRTALSAATTPGDNDATPSLFKITQPGSYYLTASIAGAPGVIGIEIAASDVTLDLSGYTVSGVQGSLAGVRAPAACRNVTVRDGTVKGWALGVDLTLGASCRLERLTVMDNTGNGMNTGNDAVVAGCTARTNGSIGIFGGAGAVLTGCMVSGNAYYGLAVGDGSSVSECTARGNTSTCFWCSGAAVFSSCASHANGWGFSGGYGSAFVGCTARESTVTGFIINGGGSATGCVARDNAVDGFQVSGGSVINCEASTSGRDGIRVTSGDCTITGNTCRGNGADESGAGVRVMAGASARIDSNHLASNDYGIHSSAECLVVRNTARANATSNYTFPVVNNYGQLIIDPQTAFIATNPWANFSF